MSVRLTRSGRHLRCAHNELLFDNRTQPGWSIQIRTPADRGRDAGRETGEVCHGSTPGSAPACPHGSRHSELALDRRALVKGALASGAGLAATAVFAPAVHAAKTLKLGYVSPQTGPLAAFAEADNFVISNFTNTMRGGLKIGNDSYPIEVVVKDSQSNPNRAADVARELIVANKIDLMLVASTPETTNPVSTMCEVEEMPVHLDRGAVAALLHRPPAEPGQSAVVEAVQLHLPLLLGARGRHRRVHQHVGAARDQQIGRRPVSQRRRRQRLGRQAGGISAGARQARLQAHRSRPLSEPQRQFHRADHRVQARQLRDRDRRGAAAGLHHVLEPGEPAGFQAEDRIRRQGAAVPGRGRGARDATATTSRPRSGGRRATRSSRR